MGFVSALGISCLAVTPVFFSARPAHAQRLNDEAEVREEVDARVLEDEDPDLVPPVFVAVRVGSVAGDAFGMGGGASGTAAGSAMAREPFGPNSAFIGGFVGSSFVAVALVPPAVARSGSWLDGRGRIWPA